MLVLSRKRNESILLADNIRITILQCGQHVRLGITAPRDVSIVREELTPASLDPVREERYAVETVAK